MGKKGVIGLMAVLMTGPLKGCPLLLVHNADAKTADAIIHEFNPYDASRDPDEIFTSFWRQKD